MSIVKILSVTVWICGALLAVDGGKPQLGGKPTMLEFRSFPAKSGNIDLALHISSEYKEVGRCLLEDESGARISIIEANQNGNIKNINDDIFQEWKKGSGKNPVTWETVLVCLRSAGLIVLADDIEEGLEGKVTRKEESATPPPPSTASASGKSSYVPDYYVEKELQLLTQLQDIADWDSLCTNLEVSKGRMEELRHSTQQGHLKKQACLRSYFDTGDAKWNDVVKVVGGSPFYKKALACKIAKTFMNMDRRDCLDNYLKDEL